MGVALSGVVLAEAGAVIDADVGALLTRTCYAFGGGGGEWRGDDELCALARRITVRLKGAHEVNVSGCEVNDIAPEVNALNRSGGPSTWSTKPPKAVARTTEGETVCGAG